MKTITQIVEEDPAFGRAWGLLYEAAKLVLPFSERMAILHAVSVKLAKISDHIDWRPIETAPKDGTRALLCCTGGAGSVSDGCFYNNAWSWEWAGVADPTHWAPLNLPGDEG